MKHLFAVFIAIIIAVPAAFAQDEVFGVGTADEMTAATTQPTTRAATTRPSRNKNPAGILDKLVQVDTADKWSDGTTFNANVRDDSPAPRVELGFKESDFPRTGSWTSPEVKAQFPFTELIASFNPNTPPNTGVTLEVRVEQNGVWSPFIYMQSWGRVLTPPGQRVKWDGGRADIDQLSLDRYAPKYQAKISLISFDFDAKSRAAAPAVRRLSVCYSGVVTDAKKREKVLRDSNDPTTRPTTIGQWARDLNVPFRGQGDFKNPRALWGMICSPTSVSMVLQYYGIDRPTPENALAIYDPYYDLFGNWGRAISYAGSLGLDAHLERFRNWEQVKEKIAAGVPVIASIRFRPGAVKGFLYEETAGHLLVIRGFAPGGDLIVNDPASRDKGNGVIYKAEDMAKAWFDNGGVGYVIERPAKNDTPRDAEVAAEKTAPTTAPSTMPTAIAR
jgi:hypothetical protein